MTGDRFPVWYVTIVQFDLKHAGTISSPPFMDCRKIATLNAL
jgi:hypothetical protein